MFNKCLIVGSGRSGTTIVSNILKTFSVFNDADFSVDDKQVFSKELPEIYAGRCATEVETMNSVSLCELMDRNIDMFLLFTIRKPVDCFMSKIYRGRNVSNGGDIADVYPEVTKQDALANLDKSWYIFKTIVSQFSDRVGVLLMENSVTKYKQVCEELCSIFGEELSNRMLNAQSESTNKYQKSRYKGKIEPSQASLDPDTAFNGYFSDNHRIMDGVTEAIKDYTSLYYDMIAATTNSNKVILCNVKTL